MIRLVLDIACNRVIYFSADPTARLVPNQHVYIREWLKPLPMGMELFNCWDWKLSGDSLELDVPIEADKKTLLDLNRERVRDFLTEVINYLRRDLIPSCELGYHVRKLKLEQAQQGSGDLIEDMAKTLGWEISEVCREIMYQNDNFNFVLVETEKIREHYKEKIFLARSNEELYDIRDALASIKHKKITLKHKAAFKSTLLVK